FGDLDRADERGLDRRNLWAWPRGLRTAGEGGDDGADRDQGGPSAGGRGLGEAALPAATGDRREKGGRGRGRIGGAEGVQEPVNGFRHGQLLGWRRCPSPG